MALNQFTCWEELPGDMHEHVLGVLKAEVAATEGRFGGAVALLALVMLRRTSRHWRDHPLLAPGGHHRRGMPRVPWHKRSWLVVAAHLLGLPPVTLNEWDPLLGYEHYYGYGLSGKSVRMRAYLGLDCPGPAHLELYTYQRLCMSAGSVAQLADDMPTRRQWQIHAQTLSTRELAARIDAIANNDSRALKSCLLTLWRYRRHDALEAWNTKMGSHPTNRRIIPSETLISNKADVYCIEHWYVEHAHGYMLPRRNTYSAAEVNDFVSLFFVEAAIGRHRVDVLQWCWDDARRREALQRALWEIHDMATTLGQCLGTEGSAGVGLLEWLWAHLERDHVQRLMSPIVAGRYPLTLAVACWLDTRQLFEPRAMGRLKNVALRKDYMMLAAWCHAKDPAWSPEQSLADPYFSNIYIDHALTWAVDHGLRLAPTQWEHDVVLWERSSIGPTVRQLMWRHPSQFLYHMLLGLLGLIGLPVVMVAFAYYIMPPIARASFCAS